MNPVKIPPYIRSNHPVLARWQSAVAKTVRTNVVGDNPGLGPNEINNLILNHPMVLGTNLYINEMKGEGRKLTADSIKEYLPVAGARLNFHPVVHAYLSQYYFNAIMERINKDGRNINSSEISTTVTTEIEIPPVEFPDSDYAYTQWLETVKIWGEYGNPDQSPYISIDANGGPSSNFGVITIPENSKIAILGDFGTGLNDATTLLIALMQQLQPDIIIHLGDIYYSGTQDECAAYTLAFKTAFQICNRAVPVFSIPGNHEYYSGGTPFFNIVLPINAKLFPAMNQKASFFSLRTNDNNWQLLGMDTGYNAVHNFSWTNPLVLESALAPWLDFDEAEWHKDKLKNFAGKTILLSHHQLFSSDAIINDGKDVYYQTGTDKSTSTYLNTNLLEVFQPYLNKVVAWFWGHEHILNIYKDNQAYLSKGRLVGNSGYEEWQGEDPYNNTGSPYKDMGIDLGYQPITYKDTNFNFYNHGFSLVLLSGTKARVNYYQYPVFPPGENIPKVVPNILPFPFSEVL